MADVLTRLKLESGEYDSKIKRATQGLLQMEQECRKVGGTLGVLEKDQKQFVQSLGSMQTVSTSVRGKIGELSGAFVELRSQYNRLTDDEKKGDFGRALSGSLEQLKTRVAEAKAELKDIQKELDGSGSAAGGGFLSGLGDKMSGALQVFAGNIMTKAAGAVANLGSEMYGMVQQGVELARQGEGIRNAFERLGRGDILDGLRQATHGTVTDIELMKAAVKFNDFKLPLDELGTMLAFAQQKAKDTGQSVDYLVESIVNGLGRKSLLILDNLGLSATEVKERMAETGDMTKAVGAIIREQMAKAGDYVETAADRAAQADVELKNAMEELGRTFQPLTDASNGLWNSIKVGALNALNTAVKPLIQGLAEVGALGAGARSTAGFNNLGGNSKVDRMIGRLGDGKSAGAYSIYKQQLAEFDKYINNKQFQIAASGHDNSSVAQSAKVRLQTELDGALKMRAEYVKRAQELHNQVPSPYEPSTTSSTTNTKGGRSGRSSSGSKSEPTFAPDSIAAQQKLVQDLTKKWNEAGADVRDQYLQPLVDAEAKLKEMQNTMDLQKTHAEGKLNGVNLWQGDIDDISGGKTPQFAGTLPDLSKSLQLDNLPLAPLQQLNAELARLKELLELAPNTEAYQAGLQAIADKEKEIANFKGVDLSKDANKSAKSFQTAAAAIGQVGSAMSRIEDPTMKIMGIVAQAIASVALGFSQATTAEAGKGVYAWIAAIAGGMATMYSTIESIHSATGYAQGGLIKGNSYSGDNIGGVVDGSQFVGLNAGELVLNASQQSMLASNLQGGGGGKMEIVGVLSGENVVLMADRWGRRTGRGELLFGKNL